MNGTRLLHLPNGGSTIVDADAPISGYRWRRTSNGYAAAGALLDGKRTTLLLHRHLTDAPTGTQVDHINGDKLDNRLKNLRVITPSINQANRKRLSTNKSGYRGVRWNGFSWVAQIAVDLRSVYLGSFKSVDEAVAARRAAELQYFGEACPPMTGRPQPGEQWTCGGAMVTVKAAWEGGVAYNLHGDNLPYACSVSHFLETFSPLTASAPSKAAS